MSQRSRRYGRGVRRLPFGLGCFLGRPFGRRFPGRAFDLGDFLGSPFCLFRGLVDDFVAEIFLGLPRVCGKLFAAMVGSFLGRPFGRCRAVDPLAVAGDLLEFLFLGRFLPV